MKDFDAVVKAFVATNAPSRWWVSFALSPFDAEPGAFALRKTKHHLRVASTASSTRVTLCVDGKSTDLDTKKENCAKVLARLEKKHGIRYRIDRAYVAGSPMQLKKAVRAWLVNVRPVDAPPSGAFETIAASQGVDKKTIARWCRALEGGAGYETKLDAAVLRSFVATPALVESAREFLAKIDIVPGLDSKRAYKRAARLMTILVRAGDKRSLAVAKRFFSRTKKHADAVCYFVEMRNARRDILVE